MDSDDNMLVQKILTDLEFIASHTEGLSQIELEDDELLTDSVMFRIIQIGENTVKLSDEFRKKYSEIPWGQIKGMRNHIVHNYGSIEISQVYATIVEDIPSFIKLLKEI